MTAARTGSLGVATTTGDLYVVDANGHLERIPATPNEGWVLSKQAGATGPGGAVIDLAWADPTALAKAWLQMDALDPVFNKINIGGAINLPTVKNRGTHSVLAFDQGTIEGIAWQRTMPLSYSAGAAMNLKIYFVGDGAGDGAQAVVWSAAVERDSNVTPDNVDADSFDTLIDAPAVIVPVVNGNIALATVPLAAGDLDGILNGEPFRVFIQRKATDGADDYPNDAQLVRAVLEEV